MSAIVRASMSQQVHDIIKNRIFSGEYQFGEPINMVTLAKEFGISNTPIREALSMLLAEGLVVTSMNSKFRVVELDSKMVDELNETTNILISGSYRSVYRNKKSDDLYERLSEALGKQKRLSKKKDQVAYIESAIAFDRCFVEATENDRLVAIFNNLADLLFLAVRYEYEHETMAVEENLKEHEDLMKAVQTNDKDLVLAELLKHYDKHI